MKWYINRSMNRRSFLRATACASVGVIAGSRAAFAADADIEISQIENGPEISPHLYGHFIEHLGGVIYDGIWVGRDSKIENIDGIPTFVGQAAVLRTAIIGAMELATSPNGRALTTIGRQACLQATTRPRPTSSELMNSCISAG